MTDHLLSAVIRLENRIQQQLQQEQARADAWLVMVRAELEQQTHATLQALADEDDQNRASAALSAQQAAAALEAQEKYYCAQLEKLSDQTVAEILRRQLVKLLPGQTDDHRDVQS